MEREDGGSETARVRRAMRRLHVEEETARGDAARRLHALIGETLLPLGISLNLARTALPREADPEARGRISDALRMVDELAASIRSVIGGLRPPVLDSFGLLSALRWHCGCLSLRADMDVSVEGEEPSPRLPATEEIVLFRIAVEAIGECLESPACRSVRVRLDCMDREVRLSVSTAVPPESDFGPTEPDGMDLMRERAASLGASMALQVGEGPPAVTVTVPRRHRAD